jgi:hypothetical protein
VQGLQADKDWLKKKAEKAKSKQPVKVAAEGDKQNN